MESSLCRDPSAVASDNGTKPHCVGLASTALITCNSHTSAAPGLEYIGLAHTMANSSAGAGSFLPPLTVVVDDRPLNNGHLDKAPAAGGHALSTGGHQEAVERTGSCSSCRTTVTGVFCGRY